jgi:methionyl-tRNA formyltransferase
MKIVFLGATKFSEEMLTALIKNGRRIEAVFSIPENFEIKKRTSPISEKYKNTNFANLAVLASQNLIPHYFVDGGENTIEKYRSALAEIRPDVILAMGWYYIIPKSIRSLAKYGAFGIHASLLPEYAGGSPLVWALINGEKRTGVTLFQLDDGVDDGGILAQREIAIEHSDTIATLYKKVIHHSKELLLAEIDNIGNCPAALKLQDRAKINPRPIRTPIDGLIQWGDMTSLKIYNFIRAQTSPYPCAYSFIESKKVKFLSSSLGEEISVDEISPGLIIRLNDRLAVGTSDSCIFPDQIEIDGEYYSFERYFSKDVGKYFGNI